MSTPVIVVAAAIGWLTLAGLGRGLVLPWLSRGPSGDPVNGLLWVVFRWYCQVMHRPTYVGLDQVPDTSHPGGMVVVSNHTGPIDPLLIQTICRFDIRWMMAAEQMTSNLDWLWRLQRMIPVARDGRDTTPAREAIRHVRGGGIIGIFPEGGIVRPTGEIRPFHNGVGLIIAKTKAPVLLIWVSDTPPAAELLPALTSRSHARVHFVDLLKFTEERDAASITRQLRQRIIEVSNWTISDDPVVPQRPNPDPFAAT